MAGVPGRLIWINRVQPGAARHDGWSIPPMGNAPALAIAVEDG